MTRVRQQAAGSYTLTCSTVDDGGTALTVVAPYTVTVRNGAGTQVATGTPTYDSGAAELTFAVPVASMPTLDTYTVTWTGVVSGSAVEWETEVELVGGFLFSIADLRARDTAFADTVKYPEADLAEVRTAVEMVIEGEKAAAVAFVTRGRRATLDGSGRDSLRLPDFEARSVLSITVDGTAWTGDDLTSIIVDDDRLYRPGGALWPTGRRNVIVHYTHGRNFPPAPIRRAGLTLAREYVSDPKNGFPARATATSIGDQMFRLTIAGRDGVTGLPDVDAAIGDHGRHRYGTG